MLAILGEIDMFKIHKRLLQAESAPSAEERNKGLLAFIKQLRKPKVNRPFYGQISHTREKCWYLNGLPKHLQKLSNNKTENEKRLAVVISIYTCGTSFPLENVWIVESGATAHVCSNRYQFKNGMKQIGQQKILVVNGQIITVDELGHVTVQRELELHDVLFCSKNELISYRSINSSRTALTSTLPTMSKAFGKVKRKLSLFQNSMNYSCYSKLEQKFDLHLSSIEKWHTLAQCQNLRGTHRVE